MEDTILVKGVTYSIGEELGEGGDDLSEEIITE